jgi:hypothetical protein
MKLLCAFIFVEFSSSRPVTPDFLRYVYCFVGLSFELSSKNKRKLASITPLGTACAISDDVVYTANHNIGKFEAFGIVRVLSGTREVSHSDIIEVALIDRDSKEDWALLRRKSGNFGRGNYCTNIILDENNLPSKQSKVAIFDYPAGVLMAPTGSNNLECTVLRGNVCWYESPKTGTESSSATVLSTWKVVESLKEEEPASRVVVDGGRSRGSCGAPYVTYTGALFAFHVASFNDDDGDSRTSHTHYSNGVVFARSPNFQTAYERLR